VSDGRVARPPIRQPRQDATRSVVRIADGSVKGLLPPRRQGHAQGVSCACRSELRARELRASTRKAAAPPHPPARLRAARGIDFAAPTGTPIYAAGDGRIEFAGRKGGYGNAVVINHGKSITTLYAHMSALSASRRATAAACGRA